MAELAPELEQALVDADLSEEDWRALHARVVKPTSRPGQAGKAAAEKRFGTQNGSRS
jgi:hypothetical protein